AVVPGQQSDLFDAVALDQVVELLVGQRLDRCGVEAFGALTQRLVHGELADHGLTGPGGSGHQNAVAVLQFLARPDLERVEIEPVETLEGLDGRTGGALAPTEGGVPLSVTTHRPQPMRSGPTSRPPWARPHRPGVGCSCAHRRRKPP